MNKVDKMVGELELRPALDKDASKTLDAVDIGARGRTRATTYDIRKTIAHGMMDTALISANANQLKFVLQSYAVGTVQFHLLVALIILSLTLQICVGVALIMRQKRVTSGNKSAHVREATSRHNLRADDFMITGLFFVIVINIFIAAFSDYKPTR